MLTEELTEYIEKQQTRALKKIYGNEVSRRKLLELSGVPLLSDRRQEACKRFAKKWPVTPDSHIISSKESREPDQEKRTSTLNKKRERTGGRIRRFSSSDGS